MLLPIETCNPLFGKYLYPEANTIRELQQANTWTAKEIDVESDKHDFLVEMTPEQRNVAELSLDSFVVIEQTVGDIWDEIASWFPHSEIDACATEIARMEKAVHAFFYQKMSETLNIDPEETARKQETIRAIKNKLGLVKSVMENLSEDKLISLATVSLVEQVMLFSNFAMLKSFKANGHNLIKNTLVGVDYVIFDEDRVHARFSTYLFRTMLAEGAELGDKRLARIHAIIEDVIRHENDVIDEAFKGCTSINSITALMFKQFVLARVNTVIETLGLDIPQYEVTNDTISEWFFQGINSIKVHDFFAGGTTQYSRSWNTEGFSALSHIGAYNDK